MLILNIDNIKKTLLLILFGLIYSYSNAQDCSNIEKKIDEFKDETSYAAKGLKRVKILAFKTDNDVSYYLSLTTTGHTLNIGEKGVYIILDDGQKIVKLDTDVDGQFEPGHYFGSGDYEYSSLFRLSASEFELLCTKAVKKFRLYIYDQNLTDKEQKEQLKAANCILKMMKM